MKGMLLVLECFSSSFILHPFSYDMLLGTMQSRSRLMAEMLESAWRAVPLRLEISAEQLDEVTPLLLESGVAALVWRRLRQSNVQASESAFQLEQAYRLHTLRAAVHERAIQRILVRLRAAGIEPVLVKGWAIARLYAEPGLRPYGDIDLCVHPEQYEAAKVSVGDEELQCEVDLHRGFTKLDERGWDGLYSRSQLFEIDGVEVRTPGPEDHLRMLCFHFLREGAWRPLWLCDIAVALEHSRHADFDWELLMGTSRKRLDWYACAIILAHRLLGAMVEGVPAHVLARRLPSWFVPTVLREWERPSMHRRYRSPMSMARHAPVEALKNLRYHWPNAIEGTIGVRGPFNELPRLPFQAGNCILRTADFLRHLPKTPGRS
jgi:hypothetical protein